MQQLINASMDQLIKEGKHHLPQSEFREALLQRISTIPDSEASQ
jgi:hypothetical protein